MNRAQPYNLWTLKFYDKALEDAYQDDYFGKRLKQHRVAVLGGALLYAIFAILDWVTLPDQKELCWIIRFCFVCPMLLLAYGFSYLKSYRKLHSLNTCFAGIAASGGIIAMIAIAPSPGSYLYYAGLLLCSMYFYEQIPDHFISNGLAWGSFILYLIVAGWLTATPGMVLFSNVFIYFFFNISGMLVCYSMELSRRQDFLQRTTIERQARELAQALEEKERQRRRAEELALKDPLTGLSNRRHFLEVAVREYKRNLRGRYRLSVMLLDIDHFKSVNDNFGHAVGDRTLQKVAATIVENVRDTDMACRYGGEEFAVLLPETDLLTAHQIGERLLRRIEGTTISVEGRALNVSASMGIACMAGEDALSFDVLLERADRMLYQAKQSGRNRVRLWELRPSADGTAVRCHVVADPVAGWPAGTAGPGNIE